MKMNEQDYLQRILNILADNAHEMCAVDGDTRDVILDVNMDGVQTVAREICSVFKPIQRDTRSRRERALDASFERMGVKPWIYHFTKDIKPFNAVTVATEKHTWNDINDMIAFIYRIYFRPSTILRSELQRQGVYGVAICNPHDNFSKHYGRNKAKGRLMQHLLKEQKK